MRPAAWSKGWPAGEARSAGCMRRTHASSTVAAAPLSLGLRLAVWGTTLSANGAGDTCALSGLSGFKQVQAAVDRWLQASLRRSKQL